jgi:hypothetical protein
MPNKKQRYLIAATLAIFTAFFFLGTFCLAQSISSGNLENDYPMMPGLSIQDIPTSTQTVLPTFIRYFFHFIVFASGLIIFFAFIKGGLAYIRSSGNAAKTKLAKEEMFSAVIGVLIVLCSWLLLNTINPELFFYNMKTQVLQITPPAVPAAVTKEGNKILQIPLGVLIENALLGDSAKANITQTDKNLKDFEAKAKELKELSKELKDLALSFTCGDSSCSGCHGSGYSCGDNYDQSAVDSKIQEINTAIDELKTLEKDQVRPNRWVVNDPRYDLKLASALLTGACPSGAITQNDFVGMKEIDPDIEIETIPGWPSNIIKDPDGQDTADPATFYCADPDLYMAMDAASGSDTITETLKPEDLPTAQSSPAPNLPTTVQGTPYALPNYQFLDQMKLVNEDWRGYACGPTSMATVLRYYGIQVDSQDAGGDNLIYKMISYGNGMWTNGLGMNLSGGNREFFKSNFNLNYKRIYSLSDIKKEVVDSQRPVLMVCTGFTGKWSHFMVIYGADYSGDTINTAYIMDPLRGKIKTLSGSQVSTYCESFTSFWP